MVFSSYLFLFYFLPLALALYYAAPGRLRHGVLTAFSYLFYGWANPLFPRATAIRVAHMLADGERTGEVDPPMTRSTAGSGPPPHFTGGPCTPRPTRDGCWRSTAAPATSRGRSS